MVFFSHHLLLLHLIIIPPGSFLRLSYVAPLTVHRALFEFFYHRTYNAIITVNCDLLEFRDIFPVLVRCLVYNKYTVFNKLNVKFMDLYVNI